MKRIGLALLLLLVNSAYVLYGYWTVLDLGAFAVGAGVWFLALVGLSYSRYANRLLGSAAFVNILGAVIIFRVFMPVCYCADQAVPAFLGMALGLGDSAIPPVYPTTRDVLVAAPFAFLHLTIMTSLMLVPAWLLWHLEQSSIPRKFQGRCFECGYDLRASPVRCPECGALNPMLQQPSAVRRRADVCDPLSGVYSERDDEKREENRSS